MGPRRANAKTTKGAGSLKYGGPGFEVDRLKAELSGAAPSPFAPAAASTEDDEDDDTDGEYADPYADEDDR